MFRVERIRSSPDDKLLTGLTIITHQELGVFEPAASFIAERSRWGSRPVDSLADETYIICLWCNYLEAKGRNWDTASESDVIEFIQTTRDGGIGENRLGRRMSVITQWYFFLAQKRFGGGRVASFAACLTTTGLDVDVRFPTPRFKSRRGPKNTNGMRKTPMDEELDRVLQALADHDDEYLSHRNFAIGSTVVNTGLRAMGLHSLSIGFVDELLIRGGILSRGESVIFFSENKANRDRVRAAILARDVRGDSVFKGSVTEKRSVTRQVQFSSQTILLLLSYIWGPRYRLLKNLFNGRQVPELWVSRTRGTGLSRTAIKDILKRKGFSAAKVEGSGHRLRATYLTQTAVKLLREARERFGSKYDSKTVLTQLALIAGHASPDSLKHYLDDAAIILDMLADAVSETDFAPTVGAQ